MASYTPQPDLLRAVTTFEIDDGAPALTFARRLALENDWAPGFAERVIVEYKRFVYLAMTAGHPVTPSEAVDEAWHLHLTYTESYWNRLCKDVLPRPLHHNPTRGGADENAKFDDWYSRTLERYRAAFGTEAPADIWPGPEIRFATSLKRRKVEPDWYWIIRKPRPAAYWTGMLLLLAGCASTRWKEFTESENFLAYIVVFFVILFVVLCILFEIRERRLRKRKGCNSSGTGCGGGGASCADGGGGCGGGGCGGGD